PVVVFPEPDSPTSPRVCPRRIVNDTSSTACTNCTWRPQNPVRPTGNRIERLRTSTSTSGSCRLTSTGAGWVSRDRLEGSPTSDMASLLLLLEHGCLLPAARRRQLAARGERAADRWPTQIGRRAVDRHEPWQHDVEPRGRPEQPTRVRVPGVRVEVGGRRDLDELARVHHRD